VLWCKGTKGQQKNEHITRTRSKQTNKQTIDNKKQAANKTEQGTRRPQAGPRRTCHLLSNDLEVNQRFKNRKHAGSSSRVDLGARQRVLIFQACFQAPLVPVQHNATLGWPFVVLQGGNCGTVNLGVNGLGCTWDLEDGPEKKSEQGSRTPSVRLLLDLESKACVFAEAGPEAGPHGLNE
jgi:hypothetical protein